MADADTQKPDTDTTPNRDQASTKHVTRMPSTVMKRSLGEMKTHPSTMQSVRANKQTRAIESTNYLSFTPPHIIATIRSRTPLTSTHPHLTRFPFFLHAESLHATHCRFLLDPRMCNRITK